MQNSETGVELYRFNVGVEAFGPGHSYPSNTNTLGKETNMKITGPKQCPTPRPWHLLFLQPKTFFSQLFSPFKSSLNVTSSEKPSLIMFSKTISYY